MKTHNTFLYIITPILIFGFLYPWQTRAAETTVSNTVSVQANGGSASGHVRTEVDGEVIEDISYTSDTGSVHITSTHIDQEHSTEITQATKSDTNTEDLQIQLSNLLALLHYYVSLLQ